MGLRIEDRRKTIFHPLSDNALQPANDYPKAPVKSYELRDYCVFVRDVCELLKTYKVVFTEVGTMWLEFNQSDNLTAADVYKRTSEFFDCLDEGPAFRIWDAIR